MAQLLWLARIGKRTVEKGRSLGRLTGVVATAFVMAARRSFWSRSVRDVLARQILFTGLEAIRFVSLIAFMIGISIVVQMQVWLARFGQTGLLGPILVMVIIREAGPLLVNFIVIGRSGTAIATELGNMKISGEVHVLDAQGLDPFLYLVVPRVLGVAVSVFCLTIVFIVVSFVSGYVTGLLLGVNTGDPGLFMNSVFGAIQQADVTNLIAKTLVPGAVTGALCCIEGLGVREAVTEVPQAATRSVVSSAAALFVVSAVVSLVTYL